MDTVRLNEWAARFIGEDDDLVPDAIKTEWYTHSPGAALVVLTESAKQGKPILIQSDGRTVDVQCGDAKETGVIEDLALLITRACYACHNG